MTRVRLNTWFDRIPHVWFDVGGRRVPAFRSLGIIGFHVALLVAILASLRTGMALATVLGLSAVAGLSFFGWGLLRRAVTGHESLVLMEYVWVAYGAVALFAWASGITAVGVLDVFSVSVPWFLAFGRFGCATVGCCHGTPAPIGLRYSAAHLLPDRLTGRRLFPVQPLEGIALVVVGVVGLALVAGPPGRATVWFLASYSVVRFGCERLRGDHRPHVWRMSVPQVMCTIQGGAAVVASEAWLVDGPPGRAAVIGAAVLGTTLIAGTGLLLSRRRNPLVSAEHLDEVWDTIRSTCGPATSPPRLTTTSKDMAVAVSPLEPGWHVSFSHPQEPTLEVALALGEQWSASATASCRPSSTLRGRRPRRPHPSAVIHLNHRPMTWRRPGCPIRISPLRQSLQIVGDPTSRSVIFEHGRGGINKAK